MPLSRDLKQLKENGAATAAEMSQFLAHLRGRRPQEVLGIVGQNGLARGIAAASGWTLVFMALFTAGPYFWPRMFPPEQAVAQEPPAAAKSTTAEPPAAQPATAVATPEAAPAAVPEVPAKDALNKLGIGEAKQADPKSNPLENKVDDLLKDLK